jgi:hypothetical protein
VPNNSDVEKRWACVKYDTVDMVIIWDGVQEWPPANDYEMVELSDDSPVGPGWTREDGEWVAPPPSEEELD